MNFLVIGLLFFLTPNIAMASGSPLVIYSVAGFAAIYLFGIYYLLKVKAPTKRKIFSCLFILMGIGVNIFLMNIPYTANYLLVNSGCFASAILSVGLSIWCTKKAG